ncbi:hypothetical protein Leryth_023788 [Lithospermum erythrorhizon]|nr:hypothetical protein Leryth_023788 [Lithospermum erythrorhizon]
MKIQRHEEAYTTILTAPTSNSDLCTKLLGSPRSSYFLIIKSQVYLGAGRFEDAVATAERAAKLYPSDEILRIEKRILAVTAARSNGNRLYEASKFVEASINYTEGLDLDPYNAILLCNRSACRSKLGQYEKAVEDCNMALNVFPSYKKARMRRADCNAKMERWEAAIQDYEALVQE